MLLSPAPYYIDFRLETPDGKIIDPASPLAKPLSFFSTPRVSYYRASLPMLAGDPAGSHGGNGMCCCASRPRKKRRTSVDGPV